MQRIIATPLASRFCAPRQRSAQSPPHARSPFRSALLHPDARSPFRSVPCCCIPTRVRRFVPCCCIPTRVRRSVLPPTDTHAPPRSALHFPLSAAAQLAAFRILETFPFIGKKMRAVALGSFRIAWKRFHFSITVYYRFLILSTLFSHFFSILFTQPYSPPPFTRYPCCGTTIIPLFFARPPPFFVQAADAEAASAKAAHEEAALSLKRHAAYPLPQTLRAGRSPPPTAPYPNRTQILTKKCPVFGISVLRTTKNRAKVHEKRTFSCENILSCAWRRERDLNPCYPYGGKHDFEEINVFEYTIYCFPILL